MDKVTAIKIRYADNTYSEKIPFTVLAENVEWNENKNLVDILGTVDLSKNIQDQITQLYNNKIGLSEINNYVNNQLNNKVTSWLDQNVTPTGSAVLVDKSLSVDGAAADAKIIGNEINNIQNGEIILTNGVLLTGYYPVATGTMKYNSNTKTMIFPIEKEKVYHITWLEECNRFRTAFGNIGPNQIETGTPIYDFIDNANTSHTRYLRINNNNYKYLYIFIGNLNNLVTKYSVQVTTPFNTSIWLDNSIFNPCMHLTSQGEKFPNFYSVTVNDPQNIDIQGGWTTQPILLPKTIDNLIIHNGCGNNQYNCIIFYDSNLNYLSSDKGGGQAESLFIESEIPDEAIYFSLSYPYPVPVYNFYAFFNINPKYLFPYNIKIAKSFPFYKTIDLSIQSVEWTPHTCITTQGELVVQDTSNYSISEYIKIPSNSIQIGHYAYSAVNVARCSFYDENKNFLNGIGSTTRRILNAEITENAKYLRICTHTPTISTNQCRLYVLQKFSQSDYYFEDVLIDEDTVFQ